MIYVIAFQHFYFVGKVPMRPPNGMLAPSFNVNVEKAKGYPTKKEASRELELLSALHSGREYRIEEVTGEDG